VLDEGMSFANTEIENLKKKVKLLEQTIQENTVNTENIFKGKIEALKGTSTILTSIAYNV